MIPSKLLTAFALVVVVAAGGAAQTTQWAEIRKDGVDSRLLAVSGMALLNDDGQTVCFLVVHDNKLKDDPEQGDPNPRVGILKVAENEPPQYIRLKWFGGTKDLPDDLEAITVVPESKPKTFIALASSGRLYQFSVPDGSENRPPDNPASIVSVNNEAVMVPFIPGGANFESFDLVKVKDSLVAVWANRVYVSPKGLAGAVFWSKLTLNPLKFPDRDKPQAPTDVTVPFPKTPNTRPISDIKVSDRKVFISAASDPNDGGPFASAVYEIGRIEDNGEFKLTKKDLGPPVVTSESHKIEALEFFRGSKLPIIFGTDDENAGGSVCVRWPLPTPQPTPSSTPRN